MIAVTVGLVGGGELPGRLEGHLYVAADDYAVSTSHAENKGAALLASVTFSELVGHSFILVFGSRLGEVQALV
jgi:hypothetical protein